MRLKNFSIRPWLSIAVALTCASALHAQALTPMGAPLEAPLAESLAAPIADPIAARYAVTIERKTSGTSKPQLQHDTWYFYREPQRIALLKGAVDEVWFRDAQQRVSFERVFHDEARVVDYNTGELATLNVQVDWQALSSLVDPSDLAQLKPVPHTGQKGKKIHALRGSLGQDLVTVDWRPDLQLPQRFSRRTPNGLTVHMVLTATAPSPLPGWPQVGDKSANYLHSDAADFGDSVDDPVVKKSEALDARLGWRASHAHP